MFSPDETQFLRDIEKLIGLRLPKEQIPGFEADPNASTAPIKQGQGRPQRNSTPKQLKVDASKRTSPNSFGPRKSKQNNERRSSN